jgi:hypothetical protein
VRVALAGSEAVAWVEQDSISAASLAARWAVEWVEWVEWAHLAEAVVRKVRHAQAHSTSFLEGRV